MTKHKNKKGKKALQPESHKTLDVLDMNDSTEALIESDLDVEEFDQELLALHDTIPADPEASGDDQKQVAETANIYLHEAIEDKLQEISGNSKQPFVDRFSVDLATPVAIENIQDDFVRELQFYKASLVGWDTAVTLLKKNKIKIKRPDDYFAEMVKSDSHMHKIQNKLKENKVSIEMGEKRRKQREQKQFGKRIQVQKLQQKQKEKRAETEALQKWKTNKPKSSAHKDAQLEAIVSAGKKPKHQARKAGYKSPREMKRSGTTDNPDAKQHFKQFNRNASLNRKRSGGNPREMRRSGTTEHPDAKQPFKQFNRNASLNRKRSGGNPREMRRSGTTENSTSNQPKHQARKAGLKSPREMKRSGATENPDSNQHFKRKRSGGNKPTRPGKKARLQVRMNKK